MNNRHFTVRQPRAVQLYGLYRFFLAAEIRIDPQEVTQIGDGKSFTGDPAVLITSLQRKRLISLHTWNKAPPTMKRSALGLPSPRTSLQ